MSTNINGKRLTAWVFFSDHNNQACEFEISGDTVTIYEKSAVLSMFTLYSVFAKGKPTASFKISDIDCYASSSRMLPKEYKIDILLKDQSAFKVVFNADYTEEVSAIFSTNGVKCISADDMEAMFKTIVKEYKQHKRANK